MQRGVLMLSMVHGMLFHALGYLGDTPLHCLAHMFIFLLVDCLADALTLLAGWSCMEDQESISDQPSVQAASGLQALPCCM